MTNKPDERTEHVFICERCEAGFLRRPMSPRHVEPMFMTLDETVVGEDCLGKIIMVKRKDLL